MYNPIIANPITTLYIAKTLKLPFFKYSNKNFITNSPVIKLAITPTTNGILNTKSLNLYNVAPKTIGVDNKNVYFAVDSLSTPINLPVVIVTPERDTPGINAKACDNPIKNVCLNVMSSYFVFDGAFLSTSYNIIPIIINALAITNGIFPNASPTK